ncbi:MAG: PaaI family thioesterase [Coriobacteriia bacterium]|nr:PaaI family thioesterase [Coriobacteriia bacterium]
MAENNIEQKYTEYHITRAQPISKECFVCGTDNELGLHAQFLETREHEIVGLFNAINEHQSYPNRMHGGITSAILDELIGRAINIDELETWGVTIELQVKYRKPVPLDTVLMGRARITNNKSRAFEGSGEIVLPDGTVAAEATGRYVKLSVERIAGNELDVENATVPDSRPVPETVLFPEK